MRPLENIKMSGIYKITNKTNGMMYIGSSINISNRVREHINLARAGKHGNPHFQKSWNKYGEDNFTFEVVELVEDKKDLLEREQYWINKTKCYERDIGYNIARYAGNTLGVKFREESLDKMRGSNNSGSTITEELVLDIKKRLVAGENIVDISREQDISTSIVNAIKTGVGWGQVRCPGFDNLIYISTAKKGERSAASKLKDNDVIEIRLALAKGAAYRDLSRKYKVTHAIIAGICNNVAWQHIITPEYSNEEIKKLHYENVSKKVKLTKEMVYDIRVMLRDGYNREQICKKYDISDSNLSTLKMANSWKDVVVEGYTPKSGCRKLDKEKVIEIRKKIKDGKTVTNVAKEYGVSIGTISLIKDKITWKDVLDEEEEVI